MSFRENDHIERQHHPDPRDGITMEDKPMNSVCLRHHDNGHATGETDPGGWSDASSLTASIDESAASNRSSNGSGRGSAVVLAKDASAARAAARGTAVTESTSGSARRRSRGGTGKRSKDHAAASVAVKDSPSIDEGPSGAAGDPIVLSSGEESDAGTMEDDSDSDKDDAKATTPAGIDATRESEEIDNAACLSRKGNDTDEKAATPAEIEAIRGQKAGNAAVLAGEIDSDTDGNGDNEDGGQWKKGPPDCDAEVLWENEKHWNFEPCKTIFHEHTGETEGACKIEYKDTRKKWKDKIYLARWRMLSKRRSKLPDRWGAVKKAKKAQTKPPPSHPGSSENTTLELESKSKRKCSLKGSYPRPRIAARSKQAASLGVASRAKPCGDNSKRKTKFRTSHQRAEGTPATYEGATDQPTDIDESSMGEGGCDGGSNSQAESNAPDKCNVSNGVMLPSFSFEVFWPLHNQWWPYNSKTNVFSLQYEGPDNGSCTVRYSESTRTGRKVQTVWRKLRSDDCSVSTESSTEPIDPPGDYFLVQIYWKERSCWEFIEPDFTTFYLWTEDSESRNKGRCVVKYSNGALEYKRRETKWRRGEKRERKQVERLSGCSGSYVHLSRFRFLELGSGSGNLSKAARADGFEAVTLDCDDKKKADVRASFADVSNAIEPGGVFPPQDLKLLDRCYDVLFCAPECRTWSYASNSRYRSRKSIRGFPGTDGHEDALAAEQEIKDLVKICKHYRSRNPGVIITFENPDGLLQYHPVSKLFKTELDLKMIRLSYCKFRDGDAPMPRKNTLLWTNSESVQNLFKKERYLCRNDCTSMSECGRRHQEGVQDDPNRRAQYPAKLCSLLSTCFLGEVRELKVQEPK